MALYSVWNWDRNAYEVYADERSVSVGDDPIPPNPGPVHILGATPDRHVKVLPHGARPLGMSHLARGEIVRRRAGLFSGLGGGFDRPGSVVLLGAIGIATGALLAPKKDRAKYAIALGLIGAGIGLTR